jgi:hypothetical protein
MPNQCYSASPNLEVAPIYYDWDWTVEWNPYVWNSVYYGGGLINTQADLDDILC